MVMNEFAGVKKEKEKKGPYISGYWIPELKMNNDQGKLCFLKLHSSFVARYETAVAACFS